MISLGINERFGNKWLEPAFLGVTILNLVIFSWLMVVGIEQVGPQPLSIVSTVTFVQAVVALWSRRAVGLVTTFILGIAYAITLIVGTFGWFLLLATSIIMTIGPAIVFSAIGLSSVMFVWYIELSTEIDLPTKKIQLNRLTL
jgi:hypothetical protein